MKPASQIKTACATLLLSGAISVRLFSQSGDQLTAPFEPVAASLSKHYDIVQGTAYDDDTLCVSDGRQEIKVRLCGLDGPTMDSCS